MPKMQTVCMASANRGIERTAHKFWGKRLRELRQDRGLTLEAASERLGIDYQRLSAYERGSRAVPHELLRTASMVWNVPIWYFFEEAPSDQRGDHRIAELLARWERLDERQRAMWWSLARQQLDLVEGMSGDTR